MPTKTSTRQKLYAIEYVKTKCKKITLMLGKETDKDIIEWLDKQGNKNAYLKDLIRKDMNASN